MSLRLSNTGTEQSRERGGRGGKCHRFPWLAGDKHVTMEAHDRDGPGTETERDRELWAGRWPALLVPPPNPRSTLEVVSRLTSQPLTSHLALFLLHPCFYNPSVRSGTLPFLCSLFPHPFLTFKHPGLAGWQLTLSSVCAPFFKFPETPFSPTNTKHPRVVSEKKFPESIFLIK